MNRIYQGRVTRVELPNPDKGAPPEERWQLLPDWGSKLWAHHELFQDAVNYYTLGLAAMAEGVEGDLDKAKAARGWREQVRATWHSARRRAIEFPGPHDRIAPLFGLDAAATGFEQCAKAVVSASPASKTERATAFLQLLEEAAVGDLNQMAVGRLPWLCTPKGQLDATPWSVIAQQEVKMLEAIRAVHAATPDTLAAVAASFEPGYFVTQFPQERMTGAEAREEAERLFESAAKKHPMLAALRVQFGERLSALGDALSLARLGRKPKGGYPLAVVFKLMPVEAVAEVLRRATETQAKKSPPIVGNDYVAEARVNDFPLFDYFTNRAFVRPPGNTDRAVWFDFDLAAFLEAIKAPHRYFQDTQKRETAAGELRKKLSALEEKGGALDDDHEEEDEAKAVGFAGDARIDLLVELLFDVLYVGDAEDAEDEVKLRPFIREALGRRGLQIDRHRQEYTIQERTLRGFADIQKRWRELAAKDEATKERLLAILAAEQGKHRDDFGSAGLYRALAEPKYQSIWRDSGTEKWHAEDPLKAWRTYTELRFELEDKTRAIRFTPAHAVRSPRYFIMPKSGRLGSEHQSGELAFTSGLMLRSDRGWETRPVRIIYSAPRLCRDRLRASGDSDLTDVPWIQPMMQALGLPEPDRQDFSNCRVTLQASSPDNIQLTFPVEVASDKLVAFVGKAERWKRQFNLHPDGDDFYNASLRWPHEKHPAKPPVPWHATLGQFSCLATDLGQRDAGAFALLEARANDDFGGKPTRFIGETPGKRWSARLVASGIFRLSGEDRCEWRVRSPLDGRNKEDQKAGSDFREELWGERGRPAQPSETAECAQLFAGFGCEEKPLLPDDWRAALSFPEQNDKLLIAARRAQSQLARLHRWCWFLTDRKHQSKLADTLVEIAACDDRVVSASIKALAVSRNIIPLVAALQEQLSAQAMALPPLLVTLANRCLPLRGRSWHWGAHPAKPDCFLLSQSGDSRPNAIHRNADGTERDVTWIRGQRGLSFKRIEQIEELRKRFQSLNQTLRRKPGNPPPKRRDDTIPDPCPDLLEKLDRTKQQRVNQTAHMILAEALGVRLAPAPSDKASLRSSRDQHGVYVRIRPPVDFIVIEDLSRYRASQGRARRENSRLMKWSHRAVRDKLKQLREVFGLPLLETPAAYSSRFCSRSGVPGFRAEEVTAGFTTSGHWGWLAGKIDESNQPTVDAARLIDLDRQLVAEQAELEADWKRQNRPPPYPKRTLLVPLSGGPIFVPVADKAMGPGFAPALAQADINAAINLALRAIADPRLWNIHSRLRTLREGDRKPGKIQKRKTAQAAASADAARLLTREKRKFGEAGKALAASHPANAKLNDTRQPNFFADFAGLHSIASQLSQENHEYSWLIREWTSAIIEGEDGSPPLIHGKSFWGCVKAAQWSRCREINAARLDKWRRDRPVPGQPEL